jgi:hypothetical protein
VIDDDDAMPELADSDSSDDDDDTAAPRFSNDFVPGFVQPPEPEPITEVLPVDVCFCEECDWCDKWRVISTTWHNEPPPPEPKEKEKMDADGDAAEVLY